MQPDQSTQACPICKEPSIVKRKWTRNKYGKKYYYDLFLHEGPIHRVRVGYKASKRTGQNEIQKRLIEFLNSTRFKLAIFTVEDIMTEYRNAQPYLTYSKARSSLLNLANLGQLSVVRKERKLFFVNNSTKDRLNFTMKRIGITLEDSTGEGTFERHLFNMRILNDKETALSSIPFTVTGDNARERAQLSFSSFDITISEKLNVYFLEDAPQRKRILIELTEPIEPGKERTISIEYFWPEVGPSHTFTASTSMEIVRFFWCQERNSTCQS